MLFFVAVLLSLVAGGRVMHNLVVRQSADHPPQKVIVERCLVVSNVFALALIKGWYPCEQYKHKLGSALISEELLRGDMYVYIRSTKAAYNRKKNPHLVEVENSLRRRYNFPKHIPKESILGVVKLVQTNKEHVKTKHKWVKIVSGVSQLLEVEPLVEFKCGWPVRANSSFVRWFPMEHT